MELPDRKDVPEELTWDLTLIYPTLQDLENDAARADRITDTICREFRGRLTDAGTICRCLDLYMEILRILNLTVQYADLAVSVDYTDPELATRSVKMQSQASDIEARLSFMDGELLQADREVLEAACLQTPEHRGYLQDLIRRQPHQLAPEGERVLAALGPVFTAPYNIYNMTKMADMKFPSFTVKGKEYPMGYSLYEDDYEYAIDPEVRRAAFDSFYGTLRRYENTTAAVYNACVTKEKLEADLRGFPSVFDSLLFPQKVTREMYDRQIDRITRKLAPHMRRYARLVQRKRGLEKMTYGDLKINLDPEFVPPVTIETCRRYVTEGLSVMGEDYVRLVNRAFDERWFDFAKNQGKSTGGFCATPYGKGSFILLTWNDHMSDVFTVAHELGHAGHFDICNREQSIYDTNVSSYMVEAPSTMNELLMSHHMLKTSDDPRFRRWVLSCMVSKTYYHNFVTHLLEAAWQREVYRIIDAGGSVTAASLNDIFRKVLTDFWGDAVEITPGSELTWMRQPHYYMGLYSYTYSAGLTLATQVCKRIEAEGAPAVEDWKKVLAAGSTLTPMELAKLAGVDLSTDAPLLDTIDTIGSMIDEIIRLTEEIDGITL